MSTSKIQINWKNIIKWFMALLITLIVLKWVVLGLLPSSIVLEKEINSITTSEYVPKKTSLEIDMTPLKERLSKEYLSVKKDVKEYVHKQIKLQENHSNVRLTQEEGFLDWIFGWGTGYVMLYKKVKGLLGSDDNEVTMVTDKFKHDVVTPGMNTMFKRVQQYAKYRMEDYQKSMIILTKEFLNTELNTLKKEGYTDLEVDTKTIPLQRYLVLSASGGFMLAEITGVSSVGVVTGKVIGSKMGAVLGPKMLGLLSTKASAIVAAKMAAASSLIFAPLVDYALNEATKEWKYEETQQMFSSIISQTLKETEDSLTTQLYHSLDEVQNRLYTEINQNVIIEGEK